MNKDKNKVIEDFKRMVKDSWTYQRLTKEEQNNFMEHLSLERTNNILKGTYNQRYEILNGLYFFYLLGIGYSPIGWRENEEEPKF